MAARKKKSPRNPFHSPSTTDAGALALILEDMRDQFRIFGEGLLGLRERMDARFDAVDARFDRLEGRVSAMDGRLDRLERRLAAVEAAITQHSAEIRELRAEVRAIRDELTRKADREELRRLDARVTELERRLARAS